MGAVIPKTCKNCGRSFLTRDKNKEFCDSKCEEWAKDGNAVDYCKEPQPRNTITKTCVGCGASFHPHRDESITNFNKRQFCCMSCYKKDWWKKTKENKKNE